MALNAVRRGRRRSPDPQVEPIRQTESLAIGEINQTVFDCPRCARPLAMGVRRCPGCGTRLVLGVQLSKASFFAAFGLAAGMALGASVGFGTGFARALAVAAPAIHPTAAPAASVIPNATAGLPSADPGSSAGIPTGMPALSRSALFQALGVNGRLSAGGAALQVSLHARTFDASAVAQTLRSISADSVFGEQLASRLTDWNGSQALGNDLARLYSSVHQIATDGLIASVRDTASYRATANAMLKKLKSLTALDAEAQAFAAQIGIELTPSAAP